MVYCMVYCMTDRDGEELVEQEIERLSAVLIPYLCERTGLSHDQVQAVMEAQETFWEHQPHVIGRMFIFGFTLDEGEHA